MKARGRTKRVAKLVDSGYLTGTSLLWELGFNNSYYEKVKELPKPALVVDDFGLYSPEQIHLLKLKCLKDYRFNFNARRFIVGEFLPAGYVFSGRRPARKRLKRAT